MGREIRRVPPNWEHPKYFAYGEERYQPMHKWTLKDAQADWDEDRRKFLAGECIYASPETVEKYRDCYEDYAGERPGECEAQYYVPYKDEEATWYQMYETVSEGTPMSPPFETKEELIDYLVNEGDFWYQHEFKETLGHPRHESKYSREAAERFVNGGWAPSFVVVNNPGEEVKIMNGVEALAHKGDH